VEERDVSFEVKAGRLMALVAHWTNKVQTKI